MKMDWDIKFGELAADKEFVGKFETLKNHLEQVQSELNDCLTLKKNQYESMPNACKVELDLFLAFTLNSLQWIALKVQGIDPCKHPIKNEMDRIKKTMLRWREVKDKEKRPKINKEATKRFIRSGLFDPKSIGAPINKKVKFED